MERLERAVGGPNRGERSPRRTMGYLGPLRSSRDRSLGQVSGSEPTSWIIQSAARPGLLIRRWLQNDSGPTYPSFDVRLLLASALGNRTDHNRGSWNGPALIAGANAVDDRAFGSGVCYWNRRADGSPRSTGGMTPIAQRWLLVVHCRNASGQSAFSSATLPHRSTNARAFPRAVCPNPTTQAAPGAATRGLSSAQRPKPTRRLGSITTHRADPDRIPSGERR